MMGAQTPETARVGGNNPPRQPCLYASGSFVKGGGWSSPGFHKYNDASYANFGTATLTTSISPCTPYVAASYVDTLGGGSQR